MGWALTLFLRQALEGSLHHTVAGPSLAPPQKEGPIFDPDSFLLPETLQHPVVEFTSFLWERPGKLGKVMRQSEGNNKDGQLPCEKPDWGSQTPTAMQAQF